MISDMTVYWLPTLERSDMRDILNIQSSLMSSFSMISYKYVHVYICRLALVSYEIITGILNRLTAYSYNIDQL